MSTFTSLNIAASGLMAQQSALNVVGHNIANASNASYHRQQVSLRALSLGGQNGDIPMGAGVSVTEVRRLQDSYIEAQLRGSQSQLGSYTASKGALDQIVTVIGEPSDNGLNADLSQFWTGWQDLSLHPDNAASRANVVQYGQALAESLNRVYTQIQSVGRQQDTVIGQNVDEVNRLAANLASLNRDIAQASTSGSAPNDLLDQRDAVLQQLSGIVDVQVQGDGGTGDIVSVGGRALVQGSQSFALSTGHDANGNTVVTWAEDGSIARVAGGTLAGAMDVQQNVVPNALASLDQIAVALKDRVNAVHSAGTGQDGVGARDFFVGTGAADLAVNPDLVADPRRVAAGAAANSPGDGSVAAAIAAIKSEVLVNGSTIGGAYQTFVSRIGSAAVQAADRLDIQTQLHSQMTTQQQSECGVSLDEEMVDMTRFQQAYNASARLFTVMDEMLSTLINNLGTGGR